VRSQAQSYVVDAGLGVMGDLRLTPVTFQFQHPEGTLVRSAKRFFTDKAFQCLLGTTPRGLSALLRKHVIVSA
jgi:hypothetical protein